MKINQRGEKCFSSFEEVATEAFHLKPVQRVTKDKEKLKSQQEKFCARHKCRACGETMEFVLGTSVMSCKNPACKGIKVEKEDEEGNKTTYYIPSFDLLDDLGTEIANNIF